MDQVDDLPDSAYESSGPGWALTTISTSAKGQIPEPSADDEAVEIEDSLAPFFQEHPECAVPASDQLMP
jgi:hypothetical protein